MKKALLAVIIAFQFTIAFAQTEAEKFRDDNLGKTTLSPTELKSKLIRYDYSKLFTVTDNAYVYGFIGDNFQRIRVNITITNIRKYKKTSYGVDDEFKGKGIKGQYLIIGTYNLAEAVTQEHAGVFKGTFSSGFYLDKNSAIHYDDITMTDGYSNNPFVGQWVSHNNKLVKRCNWGDYRIPNSQGLDGGAGEFSPNDKYLSAGWQSVRDAYHDKSAIATKAKQVENAKWWK